MIALLGIKRNTDLDIRGRFTIPPSKHKIYIDELRKYFSEVIIIATCNRTEIYLNTKSNVNEEDVKQVFEILGWNYSELRRYIFISYNKEAVEHLMEVVCGFHSRILGEDQILGQIKDAYLTSLEYKAIGSNLQRLFEEALSCGKKFRTECKIFQVPVSSVSISINKALEKGSKKFMILGYGTMGKLAVKYLLGHNTIEKIYIVVRNKASVDNINDSRVNIIYFTEKNKVINDMDAIISCTSATHTLIKREDIEDEGKEMLIFDLSVPRDVDIEVGEIERVKLYNIDMISSIDDTNRNIRRERMNKFRNIIDAKVDEYLRWQTTQELVPTIKRLKSVGDEIASERIRIFKNKSKSKEDFKLAETLIKSTSNTYINRAIEVLKEEINGSSEEYLRIISKIFLEN